MATVDFEEAIGFLEESFFKIFYHFNIYKIIPKSTEWKEMRIFILVEEQKKIKYSKSLRSYFEYKSVLLFYTCT